MFADKLKTVEMNGRKFQIRKMDAKTSWKTKLILGAKVLPFLDSFLNNGMPEMNNIDEFLSGIELDKIALAMEKIGEEDVDRLFNYGLSHCYEVLHAGPVQVLNPNGTYGVADVEYDDVLALGLIVEAFKWSLEGFFEGSRWTSIFQGMGGLFQQFAPMSMTSSSPPLSPDIGNNTNFGTELTT